ncbi:hypothetical protein GN244_ATG00785 [Phytophthora infestans]|uniref:Ubiquitin-like protease family profile domain-containing protein n=1 Tax=Phytophthora infestans TaxID=4787 RepID=A0A833TH44_PHYIN|nr:hypothetical protein GN244_ATG00785 [Phytophthora infestans]KAF4130425.1 hypothetical protein GN958_ATG20319 [Phytophthora infestans]
MPIMITQAKVKIFPGWLQKDGYSCGVFFAQWLELYLSVARATPLDDSIPMPHGNNLDPNQLMYERVKHFSYVFDRVAADVDIVQ